MPRMKVLNNIERDTFETPPMFNSVERKRCFDFPTALEELVVGLRSSTNQLGFMLTCGYFRASRRFYPPRSFHPRDLAYLAERAGLEVDTATLASYDKQTLARHQSLVLEYYGFRPFKTAGRAALGADVARLVNAQIKPKVIFFRAVELLVREKIEVPGYFPLASLILRAINQHNRALVATVRHLLTAETQALLDSMMQQQAVAAGDAPGKTSAYRLTALKKLSQSTKPATVKARVADLEQVEKSFRSLQPLLEGLALSPEALQYYAQSVLRAEIFQLSRRDEKNRYLHLAAFVAHQYYRLQDNLVAVLLTTMQRLQNRARRAHQEHCYAERDQHHESLQTLLGYFDPSVLETLVTIRALTENDALADAEKVTRIRAVLAANETATALDEGKLTELKASVLTFINEPNAADLKVALDHFKAQDGLIEKRAPVGFLTPKELAAVTGGGAFRVSLYKVLLFVHVQIGIKSGTVNLDHSYKYRPLDAYLIDRDRWQRDKALLIERAGLQAFIDPHQVIEKLDAALYAQYEITNANILKGHNKYIKFKKGRFSISTPKQEERDAGLVQEYFPARDVVPLLEILATVNRHTDWMSEFQHWQQRYHRDARPDRAIYAGVIALGCTIGLPKMARISHPISEAELENTVNWYFSLDNVIAANDRVLKLMDRLELPKLRRRTPGSSHTSSDGQKFEVAVDSLNANYSFKYFGRDQGVAVYTFRDERDLLWHSLVFSSAERESAYVLDGLLKNDVIKSDIHSTDAFGYSEAIFAGSFLVDVAYAPRFKTPYRQRLYLFRSRKDVDQTDWKIKPHAYANTDSIIASWDDVLRFIATIKLKETTASDIFRRLNSYSKQHSLYQALKAFGQIPKSLFILRYIDEPPLRMSIERVLSGIEHVHRFTRAVSVGSPQEFLRLKRRIRKWPKPASGSSKTRSFAGTVCI